MELTTDSLLSAAHALSGRSLGELAHEYRVPLPNNAKRAKGWVGELVEICLGATSGNRSQPDFDSLGIELKTMPLDSRLKPKESTFVCHASLSGIAEQRWEESPVYAKLKSVLWVPVEADAEIDLALRRVGEIFLWSPSPQDWQILKRDWEEHMETIALGLVDQLDGRRGEYLQIRPKGYSSHDRTKTFDVAGNKVSANPRGFYLRQKFTSKILAQSRP